MTDLFLKHQNEVWARVTNHGPAELLGESVGLECEMDQMELANPQNTTGVVSD